MPVTGWETHASGPATGPHLREVGEMMHVCLQRCREHCSLFLMQNFSLGQWKMLTELSYNTGPSDSVSDHTDTKSE